MGLLGLITVAGMVGYRGVRTVHQDQRLQTLKPVAVQLQQDLEAYALSGSESIQVLDTTTGGIQALYTLGISQPSRFIYDNHFFHHTHEPFIQQLRTELIQALERERPRLIVVIHKSWLPPFTEDRIQAFPALVQVLDRSYERDRIGPGYTIFARLDR